MSHSKAKEMKFFQNVQKNLSFIGFSANKHPFNNRQIIYGLMNILNTVVHFLYLFYVADTKKKLMKSLYISAGSFIIFISFLSTVQKTKTIFSLINRVEKLINTRLIHPESKALYTKTNYLAEKFSKLIYFVIVKISTPSFVLPKAIVCFYLYITTDLGPDSFELPVPTWYPFDWEHPFGYFIVIIQQLICVSLSLQYIGCFVSFALTAFLIGLSLAEDMKDYLKLIDKYTKAKLPQTIIRNQVNKMIHFTYVKRLLNYFSEIYEITLTNIFVGFSGLIAVACQMIQEELISNETDLAMLLESIFCGFWAIALLLAACEFGQRFSDAFARFDDALSLFDWYLLPFGVQRILPMIIMNAQQPMVVQCYGNIPCGRETFKKVVNTAYSYFMLLHKF